MLRFILLISCLCTSSNALPPSPHPSIYLDEEVAFNKEGIDDDTDAAADNIAAAAANDDNDDATMPPKVKPLPTKPTKKDMAASQDQQIDLQD